MSSLEKKIIKYIDYQYIYNYVTINVNQKRHNNIDYYDWKIFSNRTYDETINILHCIKIIKKHPGYTKYQLLVALHVYTKICNLYAHLIDNYTYLFATIYVVINSFFSDEYFTAFGLSDILNITYSHAKLMMNVVDNFIMQREIYFNSIQQNNLYAKLAEI